MYLKKLLPILLAGSLLQQPSCEVVNLDSYKINSIKNFVKNKVLHIFIWTQLYADSLDQWIEDSNNDDFFQDSEIEQKEEEKIRLFIIKYIKKNLKLKEYIINNNQWSINLNLNLIWDINLNWFISIEKNKIKIYRDWWTIIIYKDLINQ